MSTRLPVLAFALAAVAFAPVPVCARDGSGDGGGSGGGKAGELAEKLSDPRAQMAASAALAAMVQTILDMDISSYGRAVAAVGGGESVRNLPPDAKLGDLAGPEAERMPQAVARNVPKAMGSAAEMAKAVDEMVPQLKETARRLKHSLPRY